MSDFLSIHHVGGRVRTGEANVQWVPSGFFSDAVVTYYDADRDALSTMLPIPGMAATNVFPYCLGESDADGTLHICYDPFTSSLREPAPSDPELHIFADGVDYVFEGALQPVERRPIHIRALDGLDEIRDGKVPPPDLLVLDTQGTELEILRGARNTLATTSIALYVEVEFVEFYAGQSLFGDVAAFLRDLDFDFVGFTSSVPASRHRLPLGQRGGGSLYGTDSIWFKRVSSIANDPTRLAKLAFWATFFAQPTVTIAALQQLRRIGAAPPASRRYGRFLGDVLAAVDRMPDILPMRFDEFFSQQGSAGRFTEWHGAFFETDFVQNAMPMHQALRARQDELRVLLSDSDTPLESVMRQYDFNNVADELKQTRLTQTANFLKRLRVKFERA